MKIKYPKNDCRVRTNVKGAGKSKTRITTLLCLAIGSLAAVAGDDISGEWQVREEATITIRVPGEPDEVLELEQEGSVLIEQDGCNISYSITAQGATFGRTGKIDGDSVMFSGKAVEALPGVPLICSRNLIEATGKLINPGRIELTTTVDIRCTLQGFPGTGTGGGTVVMTRDVSEPPSVVAQPLNRSVSVGESVSFSCQASGEPAPSYQWQRRVNGEQAWIDVSNDTMFSGVATPQLSLASARQGMSGDQFRCVAENSVGNAISDPAILTVLPISGRSFRITSITHESSDVVNITWSSIEGTNYRIEKSFELAEWHLLATVTGRAGGETSYADEEAIESPCFYRVVR